MYSYTNQVQIQTHGFYNVGQHKTKILQSELLLSKGSEVNKIRSVKFCKYSKAITAKFNTTARCVPSII